MLIFIIAKNLVKKHPLELIIIVYSFLFSFWLMFSTFAYQNGEIVIGYKAHSDFSSHIPLIRSFSYGANFPPESPTFPGEPIRYHYLFYLLVGLLERVGLRLDWAINMPSGLSFSFLLMIIYFFARNLFQSKMVGLLSVAFFLFNGSLSFLEFFKIHSLSLSTFSDIAANSNFPSFGPYDGKIVSAFWNLNIFTNQRHLALSIALVLVVIYLLYIKPRSYRDLVIASVAKQSLGLTRDKSQRLPQRLRRFAMTPNYVSTVLITILLVILMFLNQAMLAAALLFIICFILDKPRERFVLILAPLLAIVMYIIFFYYPSQTSSFGIKIGFLQDGSLSLWSFFYYWFLNIGLYLVLIPLGFLTAPPKARPLIIPLVLLFIIPNIFKLSFDIVNNHKFFNLFLILGSMFVANLLVLVWKGRTGVARLTVIASGAKQSQRLPRLLRSLAMTKVYNLGRSIAVLVVVIFLTLSGVIDFMAIKNDSKMVVEDIPKNKDVRFILENTKPKEVVLNSTYLFHPASLAGRPIFYGWPYFNWSYGHDVKKREEIVKSIYETTRKAEACSLLKANNISYVESGRNHTFWEKEFKQIYHNTSSGFTLYEAKSSCAN